MTKPDEAVASYRNGFTCSSAVFSTFSKDMGLESDMAKKISCGFGAGISRTGNMCGACIRGNHGDRPETRKDNDGG